MSLDRSKRAKGVMRIRNFLMRFSGVLERVVRDCCPNRARLGCSRRRACFRVLPLAASRIDTASIRDAASGRVVVVQPESVQSVQPQATWCNRIRGCAKRTQMHRNAPNCTSASRDVAKCQVPHTKAQNEPNLQKTLASLCDVTTYNPHPARNCLR